MDRLGGVLHSDGGPAKPVSEEQMVAEEDRLGFVVPTQLRSFLRQYGSCSFLVAVKFPFVDGMPDYAERTVSDFAAVKDPDGRGTSLASSIDFFEDRLPKDLMYFASGWSEDFVLCIGVSGDPEGKIYLWDLEEEPELDDHPGELEKEKARWSALYEVSSSFGEFMAQLEAFDD